MGKGKDALKKLSKVATGSAIALAIMGFTPSTSAASSNMFNYNPMGSGSDVRSTIAEMNQTNKNVYEMKCGAKAEKTAKKGEKAKASEAKCGEKAKTDKKMKKNTKNEATKTSESKCGEGKCGEKGKMDKKMDKKAHKEASKTSESKCGEGKCGN